MKKILVFIGILALLVVATKQEAKAQIIDGAYKRTDLTNRKPTPLPNIREADVIYRKR